MALVGETGKVFALDIQEKMLRQLKRKLEKKENRDIKNVQTILDSAYQLPFEDRSLDLVYSITVFTGRLGAEVGFLLDGIGGSALNYTARFRSP